MALIMDQYAKSSTLPSRDAPLREAADAINNDDNDAYDALIAKGAIDNSWHVKIDYVAHLPPMKYALEICELPMIKDIIEKNSDIDINSTNSLGLTALHLAVISQDYNTALFLLTRGADVNARENRQQFTPLLILPQIRFKDEKVCINMADLLIQYGAEVDARDFWGWTPLHYAIRTFNIGIVAILCKHRANVNLQNDKYDNYTSMLIITHATYEDLRDIQVRIGNKDVDMNWVATKHKEMFNYMLKSNGNISFETLSGRTVLHTPKVEKKKKNDYSKLYNYMRAEIVKTSVLLKALNIPVSDKLQRQISNNRTDKKILQDCEAELDLIRSTYLNNYNDITFFDFLTIELDRVMEIAQDEGFINDLDIFDFKAAFPIYGERMKDNIRVSIALRGIMNHAVYNVNIAIPILAAFPGIIYQTLHLLDYRDLLRLNEN